MGKTKFKKCVAEVHDKMKQSAIQFFITNPLFKGIERNSFQKHYFNFFVLKKYNRGDYVFKEGDLSQNIYFLKKGEYEVTFTSSMIDINKIIKHYGFSIQNEEIEKEKLEQNEKFCKFMHEKKLIKVNFLV